MSRAIKNARIRPSIVDRRYRDCVPARTAPLKEAAPVILVAELWTKWLNLSISMRRDTRAAIPDLRVVERDRRNGAKASRAALFGDPALPADCTPPLLGAVGEGYPIG